MTRPHAFDRLALSWPPSLLFGVGAGIGALMTVLGHSLWAIVLSIAVGIAFAMATSRSPLYSPHNWDQRDLYSGAASWFLVGGMLFWMLISSPLLDGSVVMGTLVGLLVAVFFTLVARYSHLLTAFGGRRHARGILATDVTVTQEQIAIAHRHTEMLSVLLSLGAVEGVRVRTRLLAHALNTSAPAALREAREPQAAGLLYTSAVDAGGDEGKIFMALTAEGVHALDRTAQAAPPHA
ncbi:hypothetical protein H7347_00425 [Corynebacterium sp. zg-331]|uniref:hypothetical protein n=1 Tax=unclassified Corynebacterium TaxID=2624378 RepID=UPI00128B7F37|nr:MULTISPECIES: hypothetical protein [unclassified Corynebacterium]MBC3185059.1 hypothetical protein [Corynebacterium sp. zg-331]MPV51559.1 hypothetical protein [Corynebacterium sp. zg331]